MNIDKLLSVVGKFYINKFSRSGDEWFKLIFIKIIFIILIEFCLASIYLVRYISKKNISKIINQI
jgi:hypothetical protein